MSSWAKKIQDVEIRILITLSVARLRDINDAVWRGRPTRTCAITIAGDDKKSKIRWQSICFGIFRIGVYVNPNGLLSAKRVRLEREYFAMTTWPFNSFGEHNKPPKRRQMLFECKRISVAAVSRRTFFLPFVSTPAKHVVFLSSKIHPRHAIQCSAAGTKRFGSD